MSSTNITMAEVVRKAIESRVATVRVSMPGKILSFDPATQVASVQPLINELYVAEGGERVSEPLPVLPCVHVAVQSGGGMRITVPLKPGDEGLLVFSDRSLDDWWTNGQDSKSERRHDLSDAVFVPGLHRDGKGIPNYDTECVSIGSETGQADFVALASRVLQELQNIKSAFDAHTHTVASTGSMSPLGVVATTGTAAPPTTPMSPPGSVASGTVKIVG